jgi:preprotein translocase subunit YajC
MSIIQSKKSGNSEPDFIANSNVFLLAFILFVCLIIFILYKEEERRKTEMKKNKKRYI